MSIVRSGILVFIGFVFLVGGPESEGSWSPGITRLFSGDWEPLFGLAALLLGGFGLLRGLR